MLDLGTRPINMREHELDLGPVRDIWRVWKKLATYKISIAFAGIWPGNPLMAIMSAVTL
jgi:hypothetical protein